MSQLLSQARLYQRLKAKVALVKQKRSSWTREDPIPKDFPSFAKLCLTKFDNQVVPFKTFDYQERTMALLDRYRMVKIVKSRQTGLTLSTSAKMLHRAALSPAYSGAILQKKQTDSSVLSRRIRLLMKGAKLVTQSDNVGFISLANGAELHLLNSSKTGTRSLSTVDLLIDEAAFQPNLKDLISSSSASSVTVRDSTLTLISTPFAKTGTYWDVLNQNVPVEFEELQGVCDRVAAGVLYSDDCPGFFWFENTDGTSCTVVIHFMAHPVFGGGEGTWDERRQRFLEQQQVTSGATWEEIRREFDLQFTAASQAAFNLAHLIACAVPAEQLTIDPDADPDDYSPWVWFMGVDTSGEGDDYFVACVIGYRYNHMRGRHEYVVPVKGTYRVKVAAPNRHMGAIVGLAKKFRVAYVAIESNAMGTVYANQLPDVLPKEIPVHSAATSNTNKAARVAKLQTLLANGEIRFVKGSHLEKELLNFVTLGGKIYQAAEGSHDDCVDALCVALAFRDKLDEDPDPIQRVSKDIYRNI